MMKVEIGTWEKLSDLSNTKRPQGKLKVDGLRLFLSLQEENPLQNFQFPDLKIPLPKATIKGHLPK